MFKDLTVYLTLEQFELARPLAGSLAAQGHTFNIQVQTNDGNDPDLPEEVITCDRRGCFRLRFTMLRGEGSHNSRARLTVTFFDQPRIFEHLGEVLALLEQARVERIGDLTTYGEPLLADCVKMMLGGDPHSRHGYQLAKFKELVERLSRTTKPGLCSISTAMVAMLAAVEAEFGDNLSKYMVVNVLVTGLVSRWESPE